MKLLHRTGERAAVIVGQHLDQAIYRRGLNGLDAHRIKGIENLLIEVFTVGQHQYRGVVQTGAVCTQHAGKQGHGQ